MLVLSRLVEAVGINSEYDWHPTSPMDLTSKHNQFAGFATPNVRSAGAPLNLGSPAND